MISFNSSVPGTFNAPSPGLLHPAPARFRNPAPVRSAVRAAGSVMVCAALNASHFEALLRRGMKIAHEGNVRMYLVHVETLSESVRGAAKERLRELQENARARDE